MSQPLLKSLFDSTERRPLSISELTMQVKGALEKQFFSVWVEGEISNFKPHASGHWYFTVKDAGAQIRATCFRSTNCRIKFKPTSGLQVKIRGRLTVYGPRGDYAIEVSSIVPAGSGALQIAFEQMRERLAAEGLFDNKLKRPLPRFPRRVGVVTSESGAAIRDILHVIARRTRTVHVLLAATRVQGEGAGRDIARAIRLLNDHHSRAIKEGRFDEQLDVIIVGRGGGSTEDLWAFNEEVVARALRRSAIPSISAVGHETDFTICDFAADVRAATPSAAAEMVAAREDEMAKCIDVLKRDMLRTMKVRLMEARRRVNDEAMSTAFSEVQSRLGRARKTTDALAHRLEVLARRNVGNSRSRTEANVSKLSPARLATHMAQARTRFTAACGARDAAVKSLIKRSELRLGKVGASLDALSPLAVLHRGYALALDAQGGLIRSARSVSEGDKIKVRLAQGALSCNVEESDMNPELQPSGLRYS